LRGNRRRKNASDGVGFRKRFKGTVTGSRGGFRKKFCQHTWRRIEPPHERSSGGHPRFPTIDFGRERAKPELGHFVPILLGPGKPVKP
jgi:hypothetical protein